MIRATLLGIEPDEFKTREVANASFVSSGSTFTLTFTSVWLLSGETYENFSKSFAFYNFIR